MSSYQTLDLQKSVQVILTGGQTETLAPYLYDAPRFAHDFVAGSRLWKKIYNLDAYYVPREEIGTIRKDVAKIIHFMNDCTTFIDLAPGTQQSIQDKTLPFLKTSGCFQKYIALDLSKAFLKESCQVIKREHPEIFMTLREKDIFSLNLRLKNLGPVFGFLSGGTIGNLNPLMVISTLRKWFSSVANQSFLLITQDSTHHVEKLQKAYYNQTSADFALNVFYRIQRDLKLAHFDPSAFRYIAEWNPDIYAMEMWGIANKQQLVGINEREYVIKKDFPIPIARSYKLPPDMFLEQTSHTGFVHIKSFNTQGSRIYLHLLKKEENHIHSQGQNKAA